MTKYKIGNIFEIKLDDNTYAYVCLIREYSFGLFNIISEKPLTVEDLNTIDFKGYKSSKRGGISKGEWKLLGNWDLKEKGISIPDLACYTEWDIEGAIERAMVNRNGNIVYVNKEYFLELVDKNLKDGFFDNHKKFENWIRNNVRQIKSNKPMKSDWEMLKQ